MDKLPEGRPRSSRAPSRSASSWRPSFATAAARRGLARLTRQLETVLASLETLPLAEPADAHYAAIRSELERVGRTIGHNDLLIAAHARALDLTLVTRNVREFERVPGLVIEDWQ